MINGVTKYLKSTRLEFFPGKDPTWPGGILSGSNSTGVDFTNVKSNYPSSRTALLGNISNIQVGSPIKYVVGLNRLVLESTGFDNL